MIGLADFILYYNIQKEDEMYKHLCIEYDELNESKGMPNGIRHDSIFISDLVWEKIKTIDKDFIITVPLSKLEMKGIFDSLKVSCKFVENTSCEGDTNFKEKFSKDFVITLFVSKKSPYINIKRRIGHELLHCVDYVKSQENYTKAYYDNKSFFLKRLSNISYNELFKVEDNFADRFIKVLLYYSNEDELNAFIAEITLEIEDKNPANENEAYDILMKNEMYLTYMYLYNELNGNDFKEHKSEICNIYRTLVESDKNYSEGQIVRKLKNRFENIRKRLLRIIPRICRENKSFRTQSGRSFMNIFNESMKKYKENLEYEKNNFS